MKQTKDEKQTDLYVVNLTGFSGFMKYHPDYSKFDLHYRNKS